MYKFWAQQSKITLKISHPLRKRDACDLKTRSILKSEQGILYSMIYRTRYAIISHRQRICGRVEFECWLIFHAESVLHLNLSNSLTFHSIFKVGKNNDDFVFFISSKRLETTVFLEGILIIINANIGNSFQHCKGISFH